VIGYTDNLSNLKIRTEEVDGDPSVYPTRKLIFDNGSLTVANRFDVTHTVANTTADETYHRLDATNTPFTGAVTIDNRGNFEFQDGSLFAFQSGDLFLLQGAAITIDGGSITDTSGEVDFDDEDLKTSGDVILSSLTAGSIPFIGSSQELTEDNANFFWDDTSKYLQLSGDNVRLTMGEDDSTDYYQTFDGTDAQFYTSGDFVFSGGNVGIGTTSPDTKLHVMASDASLSSHADTIMAFERNDHSQMEFLNPNNKTASIFFSDETTGQGRIEYSHLSDVFRFWTYGSNKVTINYLGHLALINDSQKLQFGAAQDASIYYDGTNLVIDSQEVGTGDLIINNNGGNVGISNYSPAVKLDVETPGYGVPATSGTTQTYGGIRVSPPPANGNVVMDMGTSGSQGAWIQVSLRTNLANQYPLQLNPNGGNVGIGVADPDAKLEVSGNIHLTTDSDKLLFGTASDASIYYDGTDLVINPKEVGTGYINVKGDIKTDRWLDENNNTFFGVRVVGAGNLLHSSGDDGWYNTAFGYSSLYSNTTGSHNTANGMYSLYYNTTGSNNTAFGYLSLYSNTTGSSNTAIGYSSLRSNTTGSSNTAIGIYAGRYIADGSTPNETGSNNTFIGYNTKALADGDTNEIVIGDSAIGAGSNTVTLGNSSTTGLYLPADNYKLRLGAAGDASIYYDGTDLNINTKEVGSGTIKINGTAAWSGSWVNAEGDTVEVTDGIITDVS